MPAPSDDQPSVDERGHVAELEVYAPRSPVRLEVELLVGQAFDLGRDQSEERGLLGK